ncbi:Pyridine nucleotide-disulfide oxidoreductase [Desulfamplus magnetovallimortis]|uniref:Pyridine nucleotide-disulfide oxidoreductase n=1 Tax=Desulfamplus magnetovallimortis TaxID=1246637 RepID=A0A1W1H8L3_9BACT|nr:FAD-dependent oxidoreductase [Desulfamplus magnetovallimortis]SLM28830.1 Pyridine nucleotide-disulfide oxidoreductase [Desulfamplus magnetovallimortis]
MKYLIIGNGIAGTSAAEAIRKTDTQGKIIMVGDESGVPYSRPMITYLLEGSCTKQQLPIRSSDFYRNLDITPLLGHRVIALDAAKQSVTLANGETLDYDRLLVASGADPRAIKATGADLDNIFYMRTSAQAIKQIEALPGVKKAVVLGGGLVGFKSAYALFKRGIKVTLVITSPYPLSMQVDEKAGEMLMQEMISNGFGIRVGASAVSFESSSSRKNQVSSVILDTGEEIPCDIVIAGKGVTPAHSFIAENMIEKDWGIRVDQYMKTMVPNIYAAGDVAETFDIARDCNWINAIWPEAAIQGQIAGMNMAGYKVRHEGSLGRNVMRVFGLDVMTMGFANADKNSFKGAHFASRLNPSSSNPWYRKLVFKDNLLVGAVLVNHIEQGGIIRALIENKVPVTVSPETMLSLHFNFAKLFT